MHTSAQAHMALSIETYLSKDRCYRVLDFGSAASTPNKPTHRELLVDHDCDITGVDIRANPNVDIVMTRPYRIPQPSRAFDLVITGQVFEHVPFFWASLLEIARVLKPGGYLFMTVPSRGHPHTSQDCWRFYPDGMRALAAFAALELIEAHTDFPPRNGRRHDYARIDSHRCYWGDTVGVFRKPAGYPEVHMRVVRAVLRGWCNQVGGIERPRKGRRAPGRRACAAAAPGSPG